MTLMLFLHAEHDFKRKMQICTAKYSTFASEVTGTDRGSNNIAVHNRLLCRPGALAAQTTFHYS